MEEKWFYVKKEFYPTGEYKGRLLCKSNNEQKTVTDKEFILMKKNKEIIFHNSRGRR